MSGNRVSFRSRGGSAKLTEPIFPYKKGPEPHFVTSFSRILVLLALAVLLPGRASCQRVFGWPLRVNPQPETVITGAGAVFWNPGSLVAGVGTVPEVWLAHVDGPDATGVRGVAASGVSDLPLGFRMGVGYWHLGIQDIPRTTTSPHHEAGEINVTEDAGIVAMARPLGPHTGVGAGFRFLRGAAGRNARSQLVGEVGLHHQAGFLFTPRVGVTVMGLGHEMEVRGAGEATIASFVSGRFPVRVGYGFLLDQGLGPKEHRFSFRGSWMDQIHLGLGLSHLGKNNGWVPLWQIGAEVGRYTLSVLREDMANGFGAIHFFQASMRFPS